MPSKATRALAEQAHLLAREECRAIARALAATKRIHPAIHDARKSIRRLRALLALVDDRMPDASIIDRQLERLGDGLSLLRDAHVVVETATRFAKGHRKRWQPAIQALEARRDARLASALERDPGFLKRRALVTRLEVRIDFLDWSRLRLSDLGDGAEASQARLDRAESRAAFDLAPEHLHRWRRRVRRLRFQLEAIGKLSPATLPRGG